MTYRRFEKALMISAVVITWALFSIATYELLVPRQDNFDFFDRWYGGREVLRGNDPYTLEVNRRILEEKGYTGPFIPYWHSFGYPATITYILLFLLLLPFPAAVSIWCGLQLMIYLSLGYIVFHQFNWHPRPILLSIIALVTIVQPLSLSVYFLGQFIAFSAACLVLAVWMVDQKRPWLAGACMVGATVRPEGILLVAFMLGVLFLRRQYKTIAGWGVIMGVMLALSLLQIGFWIPDFLRYTSEYSQRFVSTYPPDVLNHVVLERLLVAGVVVWIIWMLWQIRSLTDKYILLWGLSVLILAMLVVLTQSKAYTLVYMLVPVYVIMGAGHRRKWVIVVSLGLLLSSWLFLALHWDKGHESGLEQLISPIITGAFLTYNWLAWKQQNRAVAGPLAKPASKTIQPVIDA